MIRKYSMVDLLRFKKYAEENKDLKPMELIKGYNLKYPELTEEQKLKNLIKGLKLMSDEE